MQRYTAKEHKEFETYATGREQNGAQDSLSLEKEIFDARYEQTKRGMPISV